MPVIKLEGSEVCDQSIDYFISCLNNPNNVFKVSPPNISWKNATSFSALWEEKGDKEWMPRTIKNRYRVAKL